MVKGDACIDRNSTRGGGRFSRLVPEFHRLRRARSGAEPRAMSRQVWMDSARALGLGVPISMPVPLCRASKKMPGESVG